MLTITATKMLARDNPVPVECQVAAWECQAVRTQS